MIITNLILIQLIIVFIVDLSGITDYINRGLWKTLYPKMRYSMNFKPKLLNCSLCIFFWTGLLYLIFTNNFSVPMIALVSLLAYLTPISLELLMVLKDLLLKFLKLF